ncbi:MAG: hypothetical protein ABEH43_00745, partial [Flavobacteriales bacterium]
EKINKQKALSYYLYWYKMGINNFCVFMFLDFFNIVFNTIILPFYWHNKVLRKRCLARLYAWPIALFKIPLYSKKFGSREKSLRL